MISIDTFSHCNKPKNAAKQTRKQLPLENMYPEEEGRLVQTIALIPGNYVNSAKLSYSSSGVKICLVKNAQILDEGLAFNRPKPLWAILFFFLKF